MNIANKTILVTGANRGIGRALLRCRTPTTCPDRSNHYFVSVDRRAVMGDLTQNPKAAEALKLLFETSLAA
jgi:short-subunit dehydrogenase involved in D-alanine esterification of teichoic acids